MPDEDAERIDQTDGSPYAYIQLTEILRRRILAGGSDNSVTLPAAPVIAKEFNVSPDTVRKATARLRDEGLLVTRQGRPGAYSRQAPDRETAPLRVGDRVRTDVPTAEERRRHQLPRSVKMLRVTRANGDIESYPDDKFELAVIPPDAKPKKKAP